MTKKIKIFLLFFITLMAILVFFGHIQSGPDIKSPETFPVTSPQQGISQPSFVNTITPAGKTISSSEMVSIIGVTKKPGFSDTMNLTVNYTEIQIIGTNDDTNRINDDEKKLIVDTALADDRARGLVLDGGKVEGILYQCHPTPKNFSGPACAPAVRILHKGINWDFLVDEKYQGVIFVQHDTPPGDLI